MTAMRGPRAADNANRSTTLDRILRLPEKTRGQLSFQTWPFLLAQLFLVDKLFGGLIRPAAAAGVEEATAATSEPQQPSAEEVTWTASSVGDTVEPVESSLEQPLAASPPPEAPSPIESPAGDRTGAELGGANPAGSEALSAGARGGGLAPDQPASGTGGEITANLPASAGGDVGVDLVRDVLGTVEPVTAAVAPVLETVTDVVTGVVDGVLGTVEPVTAAVAPVLETVTDVATGVVDGVLGTVEPVTAAVAPVLETVTDVATGVVDGVLGTVEPVTAAVAPVLETVTDAATGVVDGVLGTVEPVTAAVAPVLETVTDTATVVVDSVLGTVEPVTAAVAPVLETVAGVADDFLGSSGSLEFGEAPSSGQDNSLFADDRYTDLGIALNNGSVSGENAGPTAPDPTASPAVDSDGTNDDDQVLQPVQDITTPVLASATGLVDELGLRSGDGLL